VHTLKRDSALTQGLSFFAVIRRRDSMGEIKSTLELALERTRKLAITQEEREEIKRQELLKKATGLSHRYVEGHVPLQEVLREIERMADQEKSKVKKLLLSQWMEALSLESNHERLFDGIESLRGMKVSDARAKFQLLVSEYQMERKKAEQDIERQAIEELRSEGFSGTAVVPRLEGNPKWRELAQAMNALFRKRVEDIRETLEPL